MANIAILTNFQEFNEWYSLTGIVSDQCRMLTEYGNEVFLFVSERFNDKKNQFTNPNIHVIKAVPFAHLKDYTSINDLTPEHDIVADKVRDTLIQLFNQYNIDTAFSHDWCFTGWNLPYALGVQRIKDQLPNTIWMHWIHSIPSRSSDWWIMSNYGRNHKLIYPNKTDIIRVAENYRTDTSSVRVIPHIKDLRIMFNFSEATCKIIDEHPALMQADIVQVYPASSDRFEAKRVSEVIRIFGYIKSLGFSVCLMIANQWATTQKHYANIAEYKELGKKYGLEPEKNLIFTSTLETTQSVNHYHEHKLDMTMPVGKTDYKVGVPSSILFQLMQLSNLFIFPTDHETFGLVLPEVSLASGALCVLNRSLQMQAEVSGGNTLFFDFGSFTNHHNRPDQDEYLKQIAMVIIGRMQENDGILTRTFMRKKYNYDSLYAKYYAPIMAELRLYTNG